MAERRYTRICKRCGGLYNTVHRKSKICGGCSISKRYDCTVGVIP